MDMDVMISEIVNDNIIALEMGLDDVGRTVYRFSWWNGHKWGSKRFYSLNDAYGTYRLVRKMV